VLSAQGRQATSVVFLACRAIAQKDLSMLVLSTSFETESPHLIILRPDDSTSHHGKQIQINEWRLCAICKHP
jgi:hypothetical protein